MIQLSSFNVKDHSENNIIRNEAKELYTILNYKKKFNSTRIKIKYTIKTS